MHSRPAHRLASLVVRASDGRVRVPKDPKAFKDMDELRAHLQRQGRSDSGFIAGALNFISDASFGAAGAQQPWWSPARLYRQLTQGLRLPGMRQGLEEDDGFGPEDPDAPLTRAITACHRSLGPLLLISRSDTRRMASKFPHVLEMPAAEVAMRLMGLREALPGCDCCLLIEQNPRLFLSGERQEVQAAVVESASKLRRALRGAAVSDVIMCDPELLFLSNLDHGLAELRDLWDVDEAVLSASEPRHLATAVRALAISKSKMSVEDEIRGDAAASAQ